MKEESGRQNYSEYQQEMNSAKIIHHIYCQIYQEQKIIINNKNYIYYIWETPGDQLRIVSNIKK